MWVFFFGMGLLTPWSGMRVIEIQPYGPPEVEGFCRSGRENHMFQSHKFSEQSQTPILPSSLVWCLTTITSLR